MKYPFFIIILFVLVANTVRADENKQTDAHIFGHVLDKNTKEHLPYVTVRLKGTTIGLTTDATGHYFLRNLPVGKFTLEASMIGFKTATKEVVIVAGTTQEIDFELQEESVALDEVVVSANRNETTRRLAPSLVSVIGIKTLETTNAHTLSGGLKFQPGLRVENNCQNCGTTQIRINGLEGAYSQILIDSRPVIGALAGVYNLEQIPANMIERIEVMRGGGSALFGANAIGGTINIITREPVRNSGEFAHTLSSINGTGALENNTTFNASLVNDMRQMGIMVFGQHRVRDGFDLDGDGFTELPRLKNRALGFRSFLKTGIYSKITLEYQNMHEFRRGGDRLDLQPFEAYIAEQLEHYVNGASLKFDKFSPNGNSRFSLYTAAQHTDRDSYYGAGEPYRDHAPQINAGSSADEIATTNEITENNHLRINAFGKTSELTYQLGGHYIHSFARLWFMPADLTMGAEYLGSNLSDASGYRKTPINQKTTTLAAFLQNEWKTNTWSVLLGGRADKHNLMRHAVFSPRLNIRYNPTENTNLRFTYSEGFRAPQVFDEDLHVDIAGGEQVVRVLADNLHEERSRSLSGSADFYYTVGGVQMNTLAEVFFTRLSHPFTSIKSGNEIRIENDPHGARVYGIHIEAKAAYRNLFDVQGGATLQRSLYDNARAWWKPETPADAGQSDILPTRQMMRTPNVYAYFVATWNAMRNVSTTLSGNYTGSMLVPHEAGEGTDGVHRFSKINVTETTPSFFELNARIAYTIGLYADTQLQLNAGVQNIFNAYQRDFDTGAGRASGYVYGPSTPRVFFMGMKVIF